MIDERFECKNCGIIKEKDLPCCSIGKQKVLIIVKNNFNKRIKKLKNEVQILSEKIRQEIKDCTTCQNWIECETLNNLFIDELLIEARLDELNQIKKDMEGYVK